VYELKNCQGDVSIILCKRGEISLDHSSSPGTQLPLVCVWSGFPENGINYNVANRMAYEDLVICKSITGDPERPLFNIMREGIESTHQVSDCIETTLERTGQTKAGACIAIHAVTSL
jgi:hypothetical protein